MASVPGTTHVVSCVSGESNAGGSSSSSSNVIVRCPALRRDVVAQLPPTRLQGEVGHGDGRCQHHRDEHSDGRGLVARVHQPDGHERAQDPAEAGDGACEPHARRPHRRRVYLGGVDVQDDEAGRDADARSKQEDGRQGFRLSEHERSYAQATDVKHQGHRELASELVHDGGRQNKARNLSKASDEYIPVEINIS